MRTINESNNESKCESDNQNEIQDNESNPPNKKLKLESILISLTNDDDNNEIIDV